MRCFGCQNITCDNINTDYFLHKKVIQFAVESAKKCKQRLMMSFVHAEHYFSPVYSTLKHQ